MTDGSHATTIDPEIAASLRNAIDGEVLTAADAGYDEARSLWNGMISRRPGAIVRVTNTADVAAAVDIARERGLPLSVRGGGHNVAGNALCDDGVAIDLSRMRAVTVDAERRIARAQGGATLGDLDRATQEYALAVPTGVVSRTGAAGLTLHGGYGFLTRKYGLACDSLIAAEVVTADGNVVNASESENADLLWALRGGGGNFGVVTSLEYRLHPVGPDVFLSVTMYPADDAVRVMRFFRDFMMTAPNEVASLAVLWNSPDDEPIPESARDVPVAIIVAVHSGTPSEGERVTEPLRSVTTPLVDLSGPTSFLEAQQLFDPDYPDGRRYYWKSTYLRELDDATIDVLADHARARPSKISSIDIWGLGGAVRSEPAGGSAFNKRDAPFMIGIEANWDDPSDDEQNIAWARRLFQELQRFSPDGIYLNFPGFAEEGEAMVRGAYGSSYARLQSVKAKYDPDNLFRSNFNIAPAGAAGS